MPVVIGIGIALLTHLTSSTRAAANVVTAGAAAPVLSVGEDAISVGLLFSAILVPLFVLVMLAMLGVLAWFLFRSFKRVRDARAAKGKIRRSPGSSGPWLHRLTPRQPSWQPNNARSLCGRAVVGAW